MIEIKHRGPLNATESAELARLNAQVAAHVQEVAARSREVLDELAQHVSELKAKATANNGIKP